VSVAVMLDVCRDCRHPQGEHDVVIGCRHALEVGGERFGCVCLGYAE
jgi:hypothetical protein